MSPRRPSAQKEKSADSIKFLGTAGARFVMIKQLRASGGLWMRANNTNVIVDPGPGSIVRCASARPKLDPTKLDAIILTHRHLDHSNDVNVMIEAMTEGGFKKRGTLFAPADALEQDSLVLHHTRSSVGSIELLKEKTDYKAGSFSFSAGIRNSHPVETYGITFVMNNKKVALIGDTSLTPPLLEFYKGFDVVILNVVFYEPRPAVQHLSFDDAKEIISVLKPPTAILTHFGMTMLAAKPHYLIEGLNRQFGAHTKVIAASDGMTFSP